MATVEEIRKRIDLVRSEMTNAGVDYYLMTSTDPHTSEYVADHFKATEYVSGCTSDNVVLIISQKEAKLWTDGRYFISAAGELNGTGIELMKSGCAGVPTVEEYLKSSLVSGQVLGFDGTCVSGTDGKRYRAAAASAGAVVESGEDLISPIWLDRPELPCSVVTILPDSISGRTTAEKVADVRAEMEGCGASHLILSTLDDIMWLVNIRGRDVPCNPVAFAYAHVGMSTLDLFIQDNAVDRSFRDYAKDCRIKIHSYDEILDYIRDYHFDGPILCDAAATNDSMLNLLASKEELIDRMSPTCLLKACKNETELRLSREFYLKDSVALCRFIYFIKQNVGKLGLTEWKAAQILDRMRSEIPGYIDLSFPTISAFNANAAMAHYSASETDSAKIEPEGFLLVDSGGQYMGATTDVTRTIAVGPLTDEMKRDFTLVAVANLSLGCAVFRKGTTGSQLDMLARERLYRYHLDFNHGTGHGIGYILNVHEGPQRIALASRKGTDQEMLPGMLTSDEPGIYKEGLYGIRTENIILAVEDEVNEFGTFCRFEQMTFVPIDLEAIDLAYMEDIDIARLNEYHRAVREKISPYLVGEELEWLNEATEPVSRV